MQNTQKRHQGNIKQNQKRCVRENNKRNSKKQEKTQRTCICGAGLTSNPPVTADGNTCWKRSIRRSFSCFSVSYALLYQATSSWDFFNASWRFVSLLSAISFSLSSFLKSSSQIRSRSLNRLMSSSFEFIILWTASLYLCMHAFQHQLDVKARSIHCLQTDQK